MADAPTVVQHPKNKFLPRNFGVTQYKYNEWSLTLDENQSMDDLFKPENWSHVAATILGHDKTAPKGLMDLVHVRKPDTMEYAKVMITEISASLVKVKMIEKHDPAPVVIDEGSPYTTRWNVGKRMHEVLRASDKAVLKDGFQTKEAAAAWIAEQVEKTKAA